MGNIEKVWLNQYPEGIAPEIDVHAYASLQEVFERSCERFAGRPAYANMGVSMTYQELEHASRAFGAFLQHKLGMKKGERSPATKDSSARLIFWWEKNSFGAMTS